MDRRTPTPREPPPADAGWPAANQPVALAAAFERRTGRPPPPATRTAELADGGPPRPLTETADRAPGPADLPSLSRQLRALGATRLSLEPVGGAFYFGCTLSEPAGGVTVARRFEAEAPTAAAAVTDVLAQVRAHRAAAPAAADFALAAP